MAVFGAMISYAMQGLSFIVLRKNMPNIVRPYRSPVGIPGAVVTIVVALVTIYYQLQDPIYRGAVYYVAALLRARHSLLRGVRQEPAHPVARRRVRAEQGRERSRLIEQQAIKRGALQIAARPDLDQSAFMEEETT